MILSQSARLNMVSQVPYKKMHDSQTSNSRLSSELYCKDQTRSNNNSALSDTTRSPTYEGMPPLEMAWDTEPNSTTLPEVLLTQSSWITKDTETLILQHHGDKDCTTCRLCQQHFTTPRRLRVHVPQHFIMTFCLCGEYSYHRDYILRHQRTMNCHTRHLFDVDEISFPTFLELIKPFISDPVRHERLSQGFPAPRAITHGAAPRLQDIGSLHHPPRLHCTPPLNDAPSDSMMSRGPAQEVLTLSRPFVFFP